MMRLCRLLAWSVCLVSSGLIARCQAEDWPQFRGPDGQGHSTATEVPVTWSETENIAWKTAIPGLGWSSPAIRGEQIWVTSAVDEGHELRAMCVDRASGKLLHNVEVFRLADPGSIHSYNSHASPTPVVEKDRVYVHYGAHGTACLSTQGEILWKNQGLKYEHRHGPAGSPVLWKDLLILSCDGTDVQFVVALDKATGQIRWKRDRQHISEKRKKGEMEPAMAYCTPLLLELNGQTQVVSLGSDAIVAHNPADGEELWWFSYTGYSNVAMPAASEGRMFLSSGFGKPELHAFKLGGTGDLTESAKLWNIDKGAVVPMDPSPLVVGQEVYTLSDAGVAVCHDVATGKQHWQKRLGGKYWASPVVAEGKIYCLDDSGSTVVLKAGTEFEKLATNKLEGSSQASLAIVDRAIYLRTDKHLYRIEK